MFCDAGGGGASGEVWFALTSSRVSAVETESRTVKSEKRWTRMCGSRLTFGVVVEASLLSFSPAAGSRRAFEPFLVPLRDKAVDPERDMRASQSAASEVTMILRTTSEVKRRSAMTMRKRSVVAVVRR